MPKQHAALRHKELFSIEPDYADMNRRLLLAQKKSGILLDDIGRLLKAVAKLEYVSKQQENLIVEQKKLISNIQRNINNKPDSL